MSVYTLLGADGRPYRSRTPGALGGHRRGRGYGRMDCPAALRAIARGGYVQHRVFFADEATAMAAGYRPCGTCLPERYRAWKEGRISVELRLRAPFDSAYLLAYLGARTVAGVESVHGAEYRRSLALPHGPGTLLLTLPGPRTSARPGQSVVCGTFAVADRRDLGAAVRAARRIVDAEARPRAVARVLGSDPVLAPLIAARPGLRAPGLPSMEEAAIRAVVGQQISVAGARTVLGRLAADHGEALPDHLAEDGVTRLFPTAAALAAAVRLPMPLARARTIAALAEMGDTDDLLAVPGIGPWTAQYVALRTGDPDVFLAGDLGVRKALERLGITADRSETWAPVRTYATHHLWASLADPA